MAARGPCDASSDGLRWEPREVRDPGGDSDGSFVYRERDGSFLAYIKASTASPPGGLAPYDVGAGGQRMIVVSRSDRNGSVWQRPYYCTQPDWRDACAAGLWPGAVDATSAT